MNDPDFIKPVPERPTMPPEEPHDYYPDTEKDLALLVKIVFIILAAGLIFALFRYIL